MRTDGTRSDDPAEWVRWRAQRLRKAGFPADLAQRLAQQDRLDLHELLELVDRGCPPDLAARIVAPIEEKAERR
jgi:hypothetical protein